MRTARRAESGPAAGDGRRDPGEDARIVRGSAHGGIAGKGMIAAAPLPEGGEPESRGRVKTGAGTRSPRRRSVQSPPLPLRARWIDLAAFVLTETRILRLLYRGRHRLGTSQWQCVPSTAPMGTGTLPRLGRPPAELNGRIWQH